MDRATRRRAAVRGALICGGLLAAGLILEVVLRLTAPQLLSSSWLVSAPGGYNLNRANAVAAHEIPGRRAVYRLNELGHRGPAPAADAVRILVLGDSFTFGWLLNEADSYVSLLEALARHEWPDRTLGLMNAAVGGWGTADYVAFVDDAGAGLAPHAILVFLNAQDVRRTAASPLWTTTASGELERRQAAHPFSTAKVANAIPGYFWLIEHSHLAQFVRQAAIRRISRSAAAVTVHTPLDQVAATEQLFRRLKAWCEANRVPLWVTTTGFAGSPTADGGDPAADPDRLFSSRAAAFFGEIEVAFHDLGPALLAHADGSRAHLTIPDDGHPNEAGARWIAEATWPWLRGRLAELLNAVPPASRR